MSRMIHCKTCGAEIAANAKTCPACGAKNKKPVFKRWWFWGLIVVILLGAIGSGGSNDAPAAISVPVSSAPDTTPTPEVVIYTADSDSLKELFNSIVKDAADLSIIEDDAGFLVSFTSTGSYWDETAFVRQNLSNYVDFCRTAYEINGVDRVCFFISTEMTDARGNKNVSEVFNIEMPKDKFSAYNWDNMKVKSGSYAQIQADCSVFWIYPGIMNKVSVDKIYYS